MGIPKQHRAIRNPGEERQTSPGSPRNGTTRSNGPATSCIRLERRQPRLMPNRPPLACNWKPRRNTPVNETKVDKMTQEPVGSESQVKKGGSRVAILLGAVGGVAMFVGVMVWYFMLVDRPPPSLPHRAQRTPTAEHLPAPPEQRSPRDGAEVLEHCPRLTVGDRRENGQG